MLFSSLFLLLPDCLRGSLNPQLKIYFCICGGGGGSSGAADGGGGGAGGGVKATTNAGKRRGVVVDNSSFAPLLLPFVCNFVNWKFEIRNVPPPLLLMLFLARTQLVFPLRYFRRNSLLSHVLLELFSFSLQRGFFPYFFLSASALCRLLGHARQQDASVAGNGNVNGTRTASNKNNSGRSD